MSPEAYNAFCASLPAATHVVQWNGSDVWKVGGKVFALASWPPGRKYPGITFKVSDIGWEVLRDADGYRPAPYLASRGMKWIQAFGEILPPASELEGHLAASHALVAAGLTKKARRALGLE